MGPEDATVFSEEDEDPAEVWASFEAAEKHVTRPPAASECGGHSWSLRVRHTFAAMLRQLANAIESHSRAN
jgi:hypothetical protein